MKMHKKGALELSINAIVIVILAMTLLGLGLGFVRNMFKDIGETTTGVQEQMREQVLDDLRRGDKKLSFPSARLDVESGKEDVIVVGIKNTEALELNFAIRLEEIRKVVSFASPGIPAGSQICRSSAPADFNTNPAISDVTLLEQGDVVWVCGSAATSYTAQVSTEAVPINSDQRLVTGTRGYAYLWDPTQQLLSAGEANVYPITLKASNSASGTKLFKISIMDTKNTPAVADDGEYTSKTFFVRFV